MDYKTLFLILTPGSTKIELEITGKKEVNGRTRGGTESDGIAGTLIKRFDYVTSNGTYVDTKEIQNSYNKNLEISRLHAGGSLNK
ncbi:MAG: hypothetical protein ACTHMM_12200 [Agriterribacter sp.]